MKYSGEVYTSLLSYETDRSRGHGIAASGEYNACDMYNPTLNVVLHTSRRSLGFLLSENYLLLKAYSQLAYHS